VLGRLFEAWHARHDFPPIEPLYRALGLRRDGDALHFDGDPARAGLRDALMQAPGPAASSDRRTLTPAR
jgi:hypothetical protein